MPTFIFIYIDRVVVMLFRAPLFFDMTQILTGTLIEAKERRKKEILNRIVPVLTLQEIATDATFINTLPSPESFKFLIKFHLSQSFF